MPLPNEGAKTLWLFTGVFLFLGVTLVIAPGIAIPFAFFLPGIYCLWADKMIGKNSVYIGALPILLVFVPAFASGAITYAGMFITGVIMQTFIKREQMGLAVFVPWMVLCTVIITIVTLAAHQNGESLMKMIDLWVGQVMKQVRQTNESILSSAEMMLFSQQEARITSLLTRMFPAIMGTGMAFLIWMNMLFVAGARKTLRLREWRCPEWFVGVFIVTAVCVLIPINTVQSFGYNALVLVSLVYFFNGLAIIAYRMDAGNWNQFLRWVIYLLILTQFYIMIAVSLLGLFDTWFNFRKKIRKEGEDI